MTEEEEEQQQELSTEPVSLITKDFPIVVIKENGELTDDRRAQLIDQLDELLERKAHAVILDLTNAGELPEMQRVFISESLQMRSDLIAATWISVAIVVPSGAGVGSELASFWQKVTTVPSQVFTNMMSAVVWTRQALEKHVRAAREGNELDRASLRPSEPAARRSEVSARRPEGQAERSPPKQRTSRANKVQEVSPAARILRSPVTWIALVTVLATGGLFALNASFEPGLSASEEATFQKRKNNVMVRVFKRAGPKRVPIAAGERVPPGSQLLFEADLPTRAYMMILGARANGESYVALAEQGERSVGPLIAGKSNLSPGVELGPEEGPEWLHFVVCSERITRDECKLQNEGKNLACPNACVVSTFVANKAAPGS